MIHLKFGVVIVVVLAALGVKLWSVQMMSDEPTTKIPVNVSETGVVGQTHSDDSSDQPRLTKKSFDETAEATMAMQRSTAEVNALLEKISTMARSSDEQTFQTMIEQLQEQLYRAAISDPNSLAQILEYFRSNVDAETAHYLATVLGEIRDPLVEASALSMVTDSADRAQRIAGLNLLERLNISNAETKKTLLNILNRETDNDVLGNALYALRYHVSEPEITHSVNQTLTRLAEHETPEIRRRAMVALAEWSAGKQEVTVLVSGLKDASVDVRAGAAYALGHIRDKNTYAMQALAASIANENEDWQVRTLAWRSLGRYSLDAETFPIYEKFRLYKQSLNEASDTGDVAPP